LYIPETEKIHRAHALAAQRAASDGVCDMDDVRLVIIKDAHAHGSPLPAFFYLS
jgi:hypothetical protein